MSENRNEDRFGAAEIAPEVHELLKAAQEEAAAVAKADVDEFDFKPFNFDFPQPTEFVDLPSRGRCYPESHPLHKKRTVELRQPNTSAEDILNSASLIEEGVAIDRFLQKHIVNPRIRTEQLFTGDKNALLVAMRILAYGPQYSAAVTCPTCMKPNEVEFDLEACSRVYEALPEDYDYIKVKATEHDTFYVKVPKSEWLFELKWLTGEDEKYLEKLKKNQEKNKLAASDVSSLLRRLTVSINKSRDLTTINKAIERLPAMDAQYLRMAVKAITPTLELKYDHKCRSCKAETEVNVPLGVNFFWGK